MCLGGKLLLTPVHCLPEQYELTSDKMDIRKIIILGTDSGVRFWGSEARSNLGSINGVYCEKCYQSGVWSAEINFQSYWTRNHLETLQGERGVCFLTNWRGFIGTWYKYLLKHRQSIYTAVAHFLVILQITLCSC